MPNIGIDFGTTNSLIVAYDKERNSFSFFNYDGEKPVPTSSTVWYHDNNITVGSEAREKIYRYADIEGHHFEKSIKAKLGTEYRANIFGNEISPYVVASEILKHLKKEAIETWKAEKLGIDLKKAVFTIPINFSGKARQDLRKAANEAGIEVSTFIHEPFAAIVGYYFTKDQNSSDIIIKDLRDMENNYVLTFDWGGGTLDITVVKVDNGKMMEYGTAELTGLAGDKFDEEIAWWAWNKYIDKIGSKYSKDYLEKIRKRKWGRILAISEKCKINLSDDTETSFLLETVIPEEPEGIDEILSREEFSKLISPIIDKALNKVDEAILQADINCNNVGTVLLTGGTCFIPTIQDKMKEKFGHRVEVINNADLVIAEGAAVIAEYGWLPFLTKDIQIELCNNSFWALFERNTLIPPDNEPKNQEDFNCVDQRNKYAKVIIGDGVGQRNDSILGIMNIPTLCDKRFGDVIHIDGKIDKDIILHVNSYSKMVKGYDPNENYTIRKSIEIYKMCFGLDLGGDI